jgi:hypothetical protein
MIRCVSAPNDIGGQAALGFKTRKRLKRRAGQYTAEIPDYCFDHHFPLTPLLF